MNAEYTRLGNNTPSIRAPRMFAWGHAVVRNNNLQKLSSNRLAVNSAWFISLFKLIYLTSSNNSMPLLSTGICTENKMLPKIAELTAERLQSHVNRLPWLRLK